MTLTQEQLNRLWKDIQITPVSPTDGLIAVDGDYYDQYVPDFDLNQLYSIEMVN